MMNYALQLKMETSTFLGPLFTCLNLCEAGAGTAECCVKHYNARTAEQRIRLYTDLLITQQDQGIFLFSRLSSHFKLIAKENGNNESLY